MLVSNCHGAIYDVDFLAAAGGGVVSHNFFWSARALMLGNLGSAGGVEGWRFISKDQSSLWHRVLSERRKKAWWMMGSATYRSLLPDMWRTFISCFFSGPFRTRNLGMPIRSEIKLCFVVGMCWKDFHINFQCMSTLPSWVQSTCSVIVQGGRVVKVLDFTTQCHQYQRRNIESSKKRNPVVLA